MCQACLATTALALLPAGGGAEQLDVGIRSGLSWNDNVYGSTDPVDDYSVRLSPYAEVSDPDGDLTWGLRYQPSYERYLSENELSDFDHQASGSLTWRFADRWTFSLVESYGIFQNASRFNEATDPGEPVAAGFQNQEVRSNSTSAVLRRTLSRRDSVSLNLAYYTFTYPDGGGNDRGTPSASLAYQHLWSERTTLGARLSWSQQTYEQQNGDDQSQFYNLAGTLEHRFSPTFRIEASAGPTLVDTAQFESDGTVETFRFPVRSLGQLGNFAFLAEDCGTPDLDGQVRVGPGLEECSFNSQREITDDELTILARETASVGMVGEDLSAFDTSQSGGTDLTYFARLALIKDWERWSGSLVYERSNSDSAAFGSSSVADTFRASLTWTPRRHWTFRLSGAVSVSEQTTDQTVVEGFVLVNTPEGAPLPEGVTSVTQLAQVERVIFGISDAGAEYQSESLNFTASRKLSPYASVFASVYWYAQEQDSDLRGSDATHSDHLTFWVGLDWAFRPIRF